MRYTDRMCRDCTMQALRLWLLQLAFLLFPGLPFLTKRSLRQIVLSKELENLKKMFPHQPLSYEPGVEYYAKFYGALIWRSDFLILHCDLVGGRLHKSAPQDTKCLWI